eukprot:NODE_330_length_9451_cov_0.342173.p10 type:complete len:107 gc:universal NODE_330_length_9451_cov_0.342173:3980-4300(+)
MGLKVKIKQISAIASWKYDCDQEQCGICRHTFQYGCPNCDSPDKCPIIFGKCNHVFHFHCISQWLQQPSSNYTCPLDRSTFAMEKATSEDIQLPKQPLNRHNIPNL